MLVLHRTSVLYDLFRSVWLYRIISSGYYWGFGGCSVAKSACIQFIQLMQGILLIIYRSWIQLEVFVGAIFIFKFALAG